MAATRGVSCRQEPCLKRVVSGRGLPQAGPPSAHLSLLRSRLRLGNFNPQKELWEFKWLNDIQCKWFFVTYYILLPWKTGNMYIVHQATFNWIIPHILYKLYYLWYLKSSVICSHYFRQSLNMFMKNPENAPKHICKYIIQKRRYTGSHNRFSQNIFKPF